MIIFHNITLVILYIPVSQNIKGPKEKERERERERERESTKLALVLGAYDLNLSTTLSNLDTMLQRHLIWGF